MATKIFSTLLICFFALSSIALGNNGKSSKEPTTTNYCAGDTVYFEEFVSGTDSIIWDFGDPESGVLNFSFDYITKHHFKTAGSYTVRCTKYYSGYATDHFHYITIDEMPEIDLGNDTTICEGQTLIIGFPDSKASYLWNDNTTNNTLPVSKSGTYWVKGQILNCGDIDTITVTVKECTDKVEMNNVFQPGNNEMPSLKPQGDPILYGPTLVIYNRWGSKVYEGDKAIWDGLDMDGKECPQGTYFFVLEYKNEAGEEKTVNGSVTLLR